MPKVIFVSLDEHGRYCERAVYENAYLAYNAYMSDEMDFDWVVLVPGRGGEDCETMTIEELSSWVRELFETQD